MKERGETLLLNRLIQAHASTAFSDCHVSVGSTCRLTRNLIQYCLSSPNPLLSTSSSKSPPSRELVPKSSTPCPLSPGRRILLQETTTVAWRMIIVVATRQCQHTTARWSHTWLLQGRHPPWFASDDGTGVAGGRGGVVAPFARRLLQVA